MKKIGKAIWRFFLAIIIVSAVIGVIRVIIHPELIEEAGNKTTPMPAATQQPAPVPAAEQAAPVPAAEQAADPAETQAPRQTTDGYGWTSEDYIIFRTMATMTADDYIKGYKTPWGNDDWTFAKFDTAGKVIIITPVTLSGENTAKNMLVIVTPGEDGDGDGQPDSFTPHFFSVGDTVYLNDGTCDDVFSKIAGAFSS